MENYEQKYKEALEKAKDLYDFYKDNPVQAQKFLDIFPEFKESEDERIRKFILEVIKAYDGMSNSTKEKCISYLEKQKEQTTLEYFPKEKVYDIIDKLTDLSYSKLIPFKSRESQKIDEISTDILDLLDYPIKQKPEWSEEDLQHKSWILECLADGERKMPEYAEDFRAAYKWLKSLHPQPKQEWSKEDEKVRKELIKWINGKTTYEWNYEWCENKDRWIAWLEKQKEQKSVECIKFDNEFENQISHLIASVLNGEHEYNEGFVKYVAQSLLGYAKKEQKPVELDEYKIIKKHITEDVLSSEVNKRLTECGWYVTDEKPAKWSEEDKHRCGDAIYFLETAKKHYADTSEIELTIDWLKFLSQNKSGVDKEKRR